MKEPRVVPKVVLWWGIGLTVVGTALMILLPNLVFSLAGNSGSQATVDQALMLAVDFIVRILGMVVAPLGVALIGASVVMAYLRQLLRPTPDPVPAETTAT